MTMSSFSGIAGNFSQSNCGSARMAAIGLMNVLPIEAAKKTIRANTLPLGSANQAVRDLAPPSLAAPMEPKALTLGLLHRVSEDARAELATTLLELMQVPRGDRTS